MDVCKSAYQHMQSLMRHLMCPTAQNNAQHCMVPKEWPGGPA
jgi:hypothetical protein